MDFNENFFNLEISSVDSVWLHRRLHLHVWSNGSEILKGKAGAKFRAFLWKVKEAIVLEDIN